MAESLILIRLFKFASSNIFLRNTNVDISTIKQLPAQSAIDFH